MERLPVNVAEEVGVNVTDIVQLVLAASVDPQVLLAIVKLLELVPVTETAVRSSVALPLLVNVTVCGVETAPTTVVEKLSDVAESMPAGDDGALVEPEPQPDSTTETASKADKTIPLLGELIV